VPALSDPTVSLRELRPAAVPNGERPHPNDPDGPALLTFELTRASMSP
jgi:hypothetical protein